MSLSDLAVNEIVGDFYVPAYQRGYRWGAAEVTPGSLGPSIGRVAVPLTLLDMARSATRKRPAATADPGAPEGVNPKAPCPCGSGRRYKHCHGSGYAPPVTRPFDLNASLPVSLPLTVSRTVPVFVTRPLTASPWTHW